MTPTQEAIKAALEKWNALPEDERNGERPYIMGFNDGWEAAILAEREACAALAEAHANGSRWAGVPLATEASVQIAAAIRARSNSRG